MTYAQLVYYTLFFFICLLVMLLKEISLYFKGFVIFFKFLHILSLIYFLCFAAYGCCHPCLHLEERGRKEFKVRVANETDQSKVKSMLKVSLHGDSFKDKADLVILDA